MKRDWDLIRQQLTDVEEEKDIFANLPEEPQWKEQTELQYLNAREEYLSIEQKIIGHLELLIASGYIEGIKISRSLSGSYGYSLNHPRLTMAGHDLLDTMRSKTIWESIKSNAKEKGIDLTFDTIKALAQIALSKVLNA